MTMPNAFERGTTDTVKSVTIGKLLPLRFARIVCPYCLKAQRGPAVEVGAAYDGYCFCCKARLRGRNLPSAGKDPA